MKLYATITSERASKGQGGNKYLEIEIKAEKVEGIPTRANIYRINIDIDDDGFLLGSILDYSTGERMILTKAKRQKGDTDDVCSKCGSPHKDSYESLCYDCQMK